MPKIYTVYSIYIKDDTNSFVSWWAASVASLANANIMFTNTRISIVIYTNCTYMLQLWVGNRDRDHLCFSSLCIFLFIFILLFKVVITLHATFDALMNRHHATHWKMETMIFSLSLFNLVFISPSQSTSYLHFALSFITLSHHCIFVLDNYPLQPLHHLALWPVISL